MRFKNLLACSLVFTSTLAIAAPLTLAVDEFGDLQTISELPQSQRDVEAAFSRSRGSACEIIPAGESLEVHSFVNFLTQRDRVDSKTRPLASSRQDLFSVGLEFERRDRDDLPSLSRSTITSYLDDHFVSIQARVRRDLLDRKLYFHNRPLALTARYRGSKLTQSFEPLVSASIREFHSLGLFVPAEKRLKKPEDFRTIVLLFRTELLQPIGKSTREIIEFVFIRGQESKDAAGQPQLKTHVFVTSDERQNLNYLREASSPRSPAQCSILGRIAVTEFDSTGLYPKASATRNYRIAKETDFSLASIESYCDSQGWEGGLSTNLSDVLDAIIADRLPH